LVPIFLFFLCSLMLVSPTHVHVGYFFSQTVPLSLLYSFFFIVVFFLFP
jgi:hypothetical protein